jgi:hypothetical protein
LEAFVGPRPDGMEARHFPDRDPQNCRLDNLTWGTAQENSNDKRAHGSIRRGEQVGTSKLTEKQVRKILTLAAEGRHATEIAPLFCVRLNHIHRIIRGDRWRHVQRGAA